MTEADTLIARAQAGEFRTEVMGPHFTKHFLDDGRVLHHFTADDGGAIHDHPWSFVTTVLRGAYSERVYEPDGTIIMDQTWFAGSCHHVTADLIHTIYALPEGECWTLVEPGAIERTSRFWRFLPGQPAQSRAWHEHEFQ